MNPESLLIWSLSIPFHSEAYLGTVLFTYLSLNRSRWFPINSAVNTLDLRYFRLLPQCFRQWMFCDRHFGTAWWSHFQGTGYSRRIYLEYLLVKSRICNSNRWESVNLFPGGCPEYRICWLSAAHHSLWNASSPSNAGPFNQ